MGNRERRMGERNKDGMRDGKAYKKRGRMKRGEEDGMGERKMEWVMGRV